MSKNSLDQWARVLAKEIGGKVRKQGSDIQLEPDSELWNLATNTSDPVFLTTSPQDSAAWHMRLEYVEKAVAQAILAGPIGYKCKLESKNERKRVSVTVYRLGFGFSLQTGSSCRRRYTIYYVAEHNQSFFIQGTDELFNESIIFEPLNLNDPVIAKSIGQVLNSVEKIQHHYVKEPDVQKQQEILQKQYLMEIRNLDKLYIAKHREPVKTLGKPPEGLGGEDVVESEYSSRIVGITDKHKFSMRFEPLSLGSIDCKIDQSNSEGFSLPFVKSKLTPIDV